MVWDGFCAQSPEKGIGQKVIYLFIYEFRLWDIYHNHIYLIEWSLADSQKQYRLVVN